MDADYRSLPRSIAYRHESEWIQSTNKTLHQLKWIVFLLST